MIPDSKVLEFRLPDLGEGIDAAELLEWQVAVGDAVVEDQPLCDVQSDKAIVALPCPGTGTILELCARPGDSVPVGDLLVRLDVGDRLNPADARTGGEAPSDGASSGGVPARPLAAPATRRRARELGVDLASVAGSGPQGRITRADVEAAANSGGAAGHGAERADRPPAADEIIPLIGLRRTIARTLAEAWRTIPHVTDFREVEATGLVEARRALRARAERDGDDQLARALTVTPLVVKICAAALHRHRHVNASIDVERGQILLHGAIHVGIAVAAPDGLVVPVIHDADRKSVAEIAVDVATLSAAARDRSLTPAEVAGATFTVNNYGSLGIWLGTPIIAPPQVANFGIGRLEERAVVRDGEIVVRPIIPLAVSGDHRVLDGHALAAFVSDVAALVTDPVLLLAELR